MFGIIIHVIVIQPPKVISGSSTPQCKTAPTFPIDDRYSSSQGHSPRYQNIHMSAKPLSHRSPPPDGSQSVIETGNKMGTYANISFLRQNPGKIKHENEFWRLKVYDFPILPIFTKSCNMYL